MSAAAKSPAALAGANRAETDATAIASNPDDTGPGLSAQARWNAANPKARWAQHALRSAINRGLIEAGPCEVCGAVHGVGGAVVHGHHDDYERPMQVRWLCQLHHRQLHAAERREGGAA